jgi:hypothetical protein
MSNPETWLAGVKIFTVLSLIGIMTISLKEIADDAQYLWEQKRWAKFWTLVVVIGTIVVATCGVIGELMGNI